MPPPVSDASPVFKLVFLSVLGLTVLSLGVAIYLSGIPTPTKGQESLLDTCSTTWKLGFGAMLGLIGGKAIA